MAIYGSLGDIDVGAISKVTSDTATDVFVYDTRKDSDGGAWRKRTQNTSWYNETLNTATRGSRKDFPAVAVIVATTNTITIYDGDDPDMPMWMVFSPNGILDWPTSSHTRQAVSALNGQIVTVSEDGGLIFRYVDDYIEVIYSSLTYPITTSRIIGDRNKATAYTVSYGGATRTYVVLTWVMNDVAMTVLPNAPIDAATGLPVPTIAVATAGGVSVIKDDGTVVNITCNNGSYTTSRKVTFLDDNALGLSLENSNAASEDSFYIFNIIPAVSTIITVDTKTGSPISANALYSVQYAPQIGAVGVDLHILGSDSLNRTITRANRLNFANTYGLSTIAENRSSPNNGMVAYATSSYNTGWMHGDIKGAFLSDTDATNNSTEYLTNGGFDTDITGWTGDAYTTTSVTSGVVHIEQIGGTTAGISQAVTTVIGKKYVISGTIKTRTGSSYGGGFYVGTTHKYNDVGYIRNYQSQGSFSFIGFSFVATSTTTYITLVSWGGTGDWVEFEYVSLRDAEEDRSVNGSPVNNSVGKDLVPFGTITKTPVATGADLVAYSGFSEGDYLKQPHNSSLEFGTGSFSCTVWFKSSTADGSYFKGLVYLNRNGSIGEGFQILLEPSNGIYFYIYGPTNDFNSTAYTGYNDGNWHQISVSSTGTHQRVYLDGVLKETGNITTGSITDTSSELFIGKWYGNTDSLYYWRGSIALCRISASIPSPEQIKKIYEDEKVLFQENAKCTLYGSSDAVTALAYDDDNQLLHVGTSSGRSDFQGFRRINNTTTAVTTAISASNGLIAEQ